MLISHLSSSVAPEEGRIFSGLTFVLYGFDDDALPALTSYIHDTGGKHMHITMVNFVILVVVFLFALSALTFG